MNDVLDNVIQQLVKTHFGRFKVLHDLISYVINISVCEGLRRLYYISTTVILYAPMSKNTRLGHSLQ